MDDNLIERRREAFESHMERIMPSCVGWFERDQSAYLMPAIEAHWLTWNAALDSAVVELPDLHEFQSASAQHWKCAEAIERAGLRVKS